MRLSSSLVRRTALGLLLAGLATQADAQISITSTGTAFTQNFDTLATSLTTNPWTDNTTLPGWYSQFVATPGNPTTYRADAGGSNTGAIYSWGTGLATERAFGSVASGTPGNILNAVRLVNNTGFPITSLDIAFVGEQWRAAGCAPTPCTPASQKLDFQYQVAGAGTITDANTPSTGWTNHDPLDFTSPSPGTSTAAALDGNAALNRTALASTITVTVGAGQEIWLRWLDTNDANNDHGLGIDNFSVTANATPGLFINDVSQAEGNSGPSTFSFTVSVSVPAPPGGVTFDLATADNTALSAGGDYVGNSLTGGTIAAGSTNSAPFLVTVNGDTAFELTENFFVNVTNVTGTGVAVLDSQGVGTIVNDDTTAPIHVIQGSGVSSPFVGASVTTTGIVTGLKSNGFFIQEPDASVDADPLTSEGIFVFTSSAPPAAAVVGNFVQVTGNIAEFVPSQDPLQPPNTELTSPSVVLVSSLNPLPTAVALSSSFPSAAGAFNQLERVEGMRVSVASLTVVAGTGGTVSEANATATSNGVFMGVVTGGPRPFREPGIQAPDPAPTGSIPPIPRFDTNPEIIAVDSDSIGGVALDVSVGAVVTGLVGPLDYSFRRYTILPEPASPPSAAGGATAVAVANPLSAEFTVASFNMERFFDTTDDPAISDVVLTATAFNNRLNKASLGIRNFLKTPDIVGVQEVENLIALQAVASRISSDAIANAQPDPLYVAYLVEGNDIGGIDVGFLIKTAEAYPGTPRVTVNSVTQVNKLELFVNQNLSTELLNDRPPLVLDAVVHAANGATYPITVINNHLRSLNGVDDPSAPGSNGWPTTGARVRAKRLKQAESLANLVQGRQVATPTENIVLVGDFNAFDFNDGYGDSIGVIKGTPPPDNETVVPGDGIDLVNPDLTELQEAVPANRYSYVFDGSAQTLDHVLISSTVPSSTSARRLEHPRINADFAGVARNGTADPLRLSDHDPAVAFFSPPAFSASAILITGQAADGPEGNSGNTTRTWVLTKIGTGATVVPFTLGGLATYTEDYTISGSGVNVGGGTISFNSGTLTRTITVSVKGDTKYEASDNETIVLTLGTPTNGFSIFGTNSATTTITQSQDTQPNVKVAWNNVAEAAGTALVTVTLSNKSYQTVSVDAFTTDGPTASPAVAPGDYTAVAYLASTFNALQIPADALTATFTVPIVQDLVDENNETFTVSLANPVNATMGSPFTLARTIIDDDNPPTVSISPVSASVVEGNSGTTPVMFTATLSAASGKIVTVGTTTSPGSATSPSDYAILTIPSGVTFNPGETTKTFAVSVKSDTVLEADETLSVNVVPNGTSATAGSPTTATLTIQNDDSPALSINDPVLVEGNSGMTNMMFTVSITSPAPTGGVGFTYTTSDVTATDGSDYTGTLIGGPITVTGVSGGILAGNLTATILIPISGDTVVEGHETFKVTLSAATGNSATILDNEGVGTIQNDDAVAAGDLVISEFRLNGPGGIQDEFVEIANTTTSPITVGELLNTSVSGGFSVATATSGGTYLFTIPNGTTIPARGHYLGANSVGYSLLNFGGAGAAMHDASWTADIGDDTGLALFATSNAGAYGTSTPLDAVGFTTSSAQYREGAGLVGIGAGPFTKNHSFVRKHIYGGGSLQNTPDNAADFALVAVDPATYGGPSTAVLGGPSPENLAAETERTNAEFTVDLLDPASDQYAGDNYHFTAAAGGFNSKFIELRRRVTNPSLTQSYGAVRLKATSLSTLNSDVGGTQADFRPTSSTLCNGSTVPGPLGFGPCTTGVANALTLEQPPTYFTLGVTDATSVMGGLNSTLRVGQVPLLANTSVGVNFKLFYTTSGLPGFFWVTVEAKP